MSFILELWLENGFNPCQVWRNWEKHSSEQWVISPDSPTELPAIAKMEVKATSFNLVFSPPIETKLHLCLWFLSHLSPSNQTKSSFELPNCLLAFANGIGKVVFWSFGVDITRDSKENSISSEDVVVCILIAIQTWAGERKSSEMVFCSCAPWSLWVFWGERREETSR